MKGDEGKGGGGDKLRREGGMRKIKQEDTGVKERLK
jgi:hypothetical protein